MNSGLVLDIGTLDLVCLERWTVGYLPGSCGVGILAVAEVEAGAVGLEGEMAHFCCWGGGFLGRGKRRGRGFYNFKRLVHDDMMDVWV